MDDKALLYELHKILKVDTKQHKCRYGCKKKDGTPMVFAVDRLNVHMRCKHGWHELQYPKLKHGHRLDPDCENWRPVWERWSSTVEKVTVEEGCQVKKRPRAKAASKTWDSVVHAKMTREDVEEQAKQRALAVIPDVDIGSAPTVHPLPLICKLFPPPEQSYDDTYVESIKDILHTASTDEFTTAVTKLLEPYPQDEADALSEKAYGDYSFFYVPPSLRQKCLSKLTEVYEMVKVFVREVEARKIWEALNTTTLDEVHRKRAKFVSAKIYEYEALQACSTTKFILMTTDDIHTKRSKLFEVEKQHLADIVRLQQELAEIQEEMKKLEEVSTEETKESLVKSPVSDNRLNADDSTSPFEQEMQYTYISDHQKCELEEELCRILTRKITLPCKHLHVVLLPSYLPMLFNSTTPMNTGCFEACVNFEIESKGGLPEGVYLTDPFVWSDDLEMEKKKSFWKHVDFNSYSLICMPILKSDHWTLLVMSSTESSTETNVYYLDSSEKHNLNQFIVVKSEWKSMFRTVVGTAAQATLNTRAWKKPNVPKQGSTLLCGWYTIFFFVQVAYKSCKTAGSLDDQFGTIFQENDMANWKKGVLERLLDRARHV